MEGEVDVVGMVVTVVGVGMIYTVVGVRDGSLGDRIGIVRVEVGVECCT